MEDKLKKFITQHREELDSSMPSDNVWNQVEAQLTQRKKKHSPFIFSLQKWAVAASIITMLSITAFWLVDNRQDEVQTAEQTMTNENRATSLPPLEKPLLEKEPESNDSQSLSRIREKRTLSRSKTDVSSSYDKIVPASLTEESNSLSLIEDQLSASNRIKGVIQIQSEETISPETLKLLRQMVTEDPNSNVRLVALEVLMDWIPDADRPEKIQELFIAQDDMALQMEFMQVFHQNDSLRINTATANRLKEITEDPFSVDILKEQAYAVLMRTW